MDIFVDKCSGGFVVYVFCHDCGTKWERTFYRKSEVDKYIGSYREENPRVTWQN